MEEPAIKKRRVLRSSSAKKPNLSTIERREISNTEVKLYEEADINILAAIRAQKKAMLSLKRLSKKVNDGITSVALQELIDGHDALVDLRQSVVESRTKFSQVRLDDIIHVDLITLKLIHFLPRKDIGNLRLSCKKIYKHVTTLCDQFNVWKIDLNRFRQFPPSACFFTSDKVMEMTLPRIPLTPIQRDILEKCANRIVVLDGSANLHGYQALQDIPASACENMTSLQSLTVGQTRYQSRKNFIILLNQSGESLQEMALSRFDPKNLTLLEPSRKFFQLTRLHLQNCKSSERSVREEDWPKVAKLINNCPNLVDLSLQYFTITEEAIAPHTKMKKLELFMLFHTPVAANIINLMMSCRESLEYLKIHCISTSQIFAREWVLPKVKRVRIKSNLSTDEKAVLKEHFNKNARITVQDARVIADFFP